MALQLSKTFDTGLSSASTYARISRITSMHDTGNDNHFIEVSFYADAQARADGKKPVEVITFGPRPYDDTVSESIAGHYTWLKTAYSEDAEGNPTGGPEGDIFEGAIDV